MKESFVSIERDLSGIGGGGQALITIELLPNWFEKKILGKEPYLEQYRGYSTSWRRAGDAQRPPYDIQMWFHVLWNEWWEKQLVRDY